MDVPDFRAFLTVDRGVFSAGRGRPRHRGASRTTVREARGLPADGDLLDLGCGYGPIACTVAHRHPDRTVWAVDVNTRALELTADNAAQLGLPNVRPCAPEDFPTSVRLAAMWSNPPIRVGKEALHAILERWLPLLAPGAEARLVVHRHLGADSLAAWLSGQGWAVSRLASKRGYRILAVGVR